MVPPQYHKSNLLKRPKISRNSQNKTNRIIILDNRISLIDKIQSLYIKRSKRLRINNDE